MRIPWCSPQALVTAGLVVGISLAWGGAAHAAERSQRQSRWWEVKPAPLADMRDDPEATKAVIEVARKVYRKILEAGMRDGMRNSFYAGRRWPLGITDDEIRELVQLTVKYRETRAALLAKFVIGHLLNVNGTATGAPDWDYEKGDMEDIVRDYPGTPEATIARLLLLKVDTRPRPLWEARYPVGGSGKEESGRIQKAEVRLLAALRASVAELSRIDADQGTIPRALSQFVSGSFKSKPVEGLELWARDWIGYEEMLRLNYDVAIDVYRQIARDYRGTPAEASAEDSIRLIVGMKKDNEECQKRSKSWPGDAPASEGEDVSPIDSKGTAPLRGGWSAWRVGIFVAGMALPLVLALAIAIRRRRSKVPQHDPGAGRG